MNAYAVSFFEVFDRCNITLEHLKTLYYPWPMAMAIRLKICPALI
jgi:hypothetical protein